MRQKASQRNDMTRKYVGYLGLLNEQSKCTEYYRLYKDCEMDLNNLSHEHVRDSVS
jgi:hypothetical protein